MDSEEELLEGVQRAEAAGASASLARALDNLAGQTLKTKNEEEA